MQVGTILHEHEKARDPTYGAPGHTDLHAVSYREPPAEAATFAETQIADRAQSSSRVRAACALSKFVRENFRVAPHHVCMIPVPNDTFLESCCIGEIFLATLSGPT